MRPGRLALALVCAAAPAALAVPGVPLVVTQVHRAFAVREVHINRGDVIRFSNADEFLHHIYIHSPTFNFTSDEQSPGQDVDVRFPVAGRFEVRCEIHPKMMLQVSVE